MAEQECMNEQQWLAENDDPGRMLNLIHSRWIESAYNGVSPRKLRLFVAAACRDSVSRTHGPEIRALAALETLADEGPGDAELAVSQAWGPGTIRFPRPGIAIGTMAGAWAHAQLMVEPPMSKGHRIFRCSALRCIFGNPCRPLPLWRQETPAGLGPIGDWKTSWLAWNDGAVRKMAEEIYGGEEICIFCDGSGLDLLKSCDCCEGSGKVAAPFQSHLLPLLADELERAGCDDAAILDHCRNWDLMPCPTVCKKVNGTYRVASGEICPTCQGSSGGVPAPHVRGCWVVDLILGKA